MIEELVAKVWDNPRFHILAREIEVAWLSKELRLSAAEGPPVEKLLRSVQSAAILACSQDTLHRIAAYRAATYAYDLRGEGSPWDEMIRVVLARLGNFPAMQTRSSIDRAIARLPIRFAAEEIASSDARTITVGGEPITLTDFQHELWRRLWTRERVALSAPTSAGKSFVLQAFLATLFDEDRPFHVVYLVPTRALIAQVSADLIERFSAYDNSPEILTMPPEEGIALPNRVVFVLTQERCQLLLQAHEKFHAELIVVDEAHSVADGSRGILLQWVIDDLLVRSTVTQILFASPIVRNLEVFGRLFGLPDVKPFKSIEPTVSQNFIFADVITAKQGVVEFSADITDDDGRQHLGRKVLGATLASRKDCLVHIPLCMEGTGSSLVYANGAAEAEEVALQLADSLSASRSSTPERDELAQLAREVVHEKYVIAECIRFGVAFHYSNIPTVLRLEIENAFKAGVIDFLTCTSTLLQGVNLPARHIFMSSPEKGRKNALQGTDFWNLSGRAGRLRHEFQGNIFLINYSRWKSQPLSEERDTEIRPALESTLSDATSDLISVIRHESPSSGNRKTDDLESSFVRLFSDFREGKLSQTFQRTGISDQSDVLQELTSALGDVSSEISLPSKILKRAGNISAHKQQKLFDLIFEGVSQDKELATLMIPAHPREKDSYKSHCRILALCYEILLGRDPSRGLHNFHALIASRWMNGWSLPRIIQAQIDRNPEKSVRTVIRDTLELVEGQVRFQVARMFSCYNGLLEHAFQLNGQGDLITSIPSIPLFLEVGASDQTMISFMAIGLSRVTAMKLNESAADKNMDTAAARSWLRSRPLESLGLSPLLIREVTNALAAHLN